MLMLAVLIIIGILTLGNSVMIVFLASCVGKHHHGGFTQGTTIKYKK